MKKNLFLLLPSLAMILAGCDGDKEDNQTPDQQQQIVTYTVTFKDEDGNVLESKAWGEGTTPSYSYSKTDTAEWDYTFEGWSSTQGGDVLTTLPEVTSDTTYWAVVSKVKQKYDISFYDENEKLIETFNLEYGAQPVCNYTGQEDDAEYTYEFKGWATTQGGTPLDRVPAVTGAADYYAIVAQTKNKYTITFDSKEGSSVSSITEDYGTVVNEPTKPTKEGYKFTGWSTDSSGENQISWPITLQSNMTLYANWNEKVNIKAYFQALVETVGHNPYSYIPESMKPDFSANHVSESDVTYDFNSFTNVSDIKYGGYGEQWQMVIENIQDSEKFYSVLSLGEAAINASVALFNNYLDSNTDDTASHSLDETTYKAKIDFHNGILQYSISYKTNINIPFFGEVNPQIDMIYNVSTLEKSVRIQLTENNALKYVVTNNHYVFAIQYGVTAVSRKAYCQIDRLNDESVQGHIYEYVQFKDKDLVPSCADFYIGNEYVSVVGNKASGITGFTGYINELYDLESGKLVGYKVKETFTKWGFEKTYNTLWFNLSDISAITTVKAVENSSIDPHENHHDIYLNGSGSIFEPMKNKYLLVSTSRKYDVELRKQFFYGYKDTVLTKYETEVPMMFIQDDGTEKGEDNFSTFEDDILSKNSIAASVTLANKYLQKIREDYLELIDIFIAHKNEVTGDSITTYIGTALDIE